MGGYDLNGSLGSIGVEGGGRTMTAAGFPDSGVLVKALSTVCSSLTILSEVCNSDQTVGIESVDEL